MPRLNLATGGVGPLQKPQANEAALLEANADDAALHQAVAKVGKSGELAIRFPKFNDGRGFSLARLLRERHGFTGTLVATGHLIPDQAMFLKRSGFDVALLPTIDHVADWQRALTAFTGTYQQAYRNREIQRRSAAA